MNSDWLRAVQLFLKLHNYKKQSMKATQENEQVIVWFLVQFGKTYTREFFKDSSFGFVQF